MGKYLPIIVPVTAALLVLLFGYLYIQAGKSANTGSKTTEFSFQGLGNGPKEVPKDLPDPVRIENLEGSVSSLVGQLNSLKSSIATASPQTQNSALVDYRLKALEASALELKARVAALEKPASTQSSSRPPYYVPLGTGSESGDQNWISIPTYQIVLDPSDYPGYTSVILEINMKLNQASGTGYARLYNSTDSQAMVSEVSTTSDKYGWFTSSGFKLTEGKKTYQLQLKSATGTIIALQSARLKISF